jgi:hypothetical protein
MEVQTAGQGKLLAQGALHAAVAVFQTADRSDIPARETQPPRSVMNLPA